MVYAFLYAVLPYNIHMTSDESYMQVALQEARNARDANEVPVGALVVCDGKIIAAEHNRREANASPEAHAEVLAIEAAARALNRWRLNNCTVYVTLEPCIMCAGLMLNARIARCVFGAKDPKAGALGSVIDVHDIPTLNHSFRVTEGILAKESAELLRSFFRARR